GPAGKPSDILRPTDRRIDSPADRHLPPGDPRKSHDDCPIQLAIDARPPPEAQLSPFPQDDLVETPAPRPSLAPFGVLSADEGTNPTCTVRGSRPPPAIIVPRRSDTSCDYIELHARSA